MLITTACAMVNRTITRRMTFAQASGVSVEFAGTGVVIDGLLMAIEYGRTARVAGMASRPNRISVLH